MTSAEMIMAGAVILGASIILAAVGAAMMDAGRKNLYNETYRSLVQ